MTRRSTFALLILSTAKLLAVEWSPVADFDSQLLPSYWIAAATMESEPFSDPAFMGDPEGTLGVVVEKPPGGKKFKVTLRKTDLWEESSLGGTFPKNLDTIAIYPRIHFNYGKLREVTQMIPLTAIFDLEVEGEEKTTQSIVLNVHDVNDCIFGLLDRADEEEEGEYVDLGWMFAAYVNESHPMLDPIMKKAPDSGIVDSFDDYQSGDASKVLAQVFAIWYALHEQGIRYSNAVTTPEGSDIVFSQNVRFIEQSYHNSQANCVDGSVLMASLLRKIGVNPYLILVPGHMFLAFDLDPEGETILGLETTLVGSQTAQGAEELAVLRERLPEELLEHPSLAAFEAALAVGTGSLEEHEEKFEADDSPMFQMISVDAARDDGVMPIPYRKD